MTYGLATILLIVFCVCAQCVTILDNRQTWPLPSLVTSSIWSCHHHLCKHTPRQRTHTWFLTGFFGVYATQCYWDVLGSFTHCNAKLFFLLSSHPASMNFVFNVFCFVLIEQMAQSRHLGCRPCLWGAQEGKTMTENWADDGGRGGGGSTAPSIHSCQWPWSLHELCG